MFRGQKGITLVALVITIIVLLILAGVTIAALSGDNGILTNASKSQQENAIGNAKDLVSMAINEATNAYYSYTYLNDTTVSNVAEGDQITTSMNYVNAIDEADDATIEAFKATNGTYKDKYYVVIKTTDKAPKTVFSEIVSGGGLSGTWTEVTDTVAVPTK